MALVINSTYAGDKASDYIAAALLEANTISQGGVTVMPNIKYKGILPTLAVSNILQDSACDFTDQGDVNLDERVLEPKELMVNHTICKTPFIQTWDAAQMGYSAFDTLPNNFSQFLIAQMIGVVAEANENNLWHGNKNNAGEFDGLATKIDADAGIPVNQKITGEAITVDNVITEMSKVVAEIPKSVYTKEDLRLYVSINIYKAYKAALGGFSTASNTSAGYRDQGTNQDINIQWFNGVQIFVANGLNDNVMIATRVSNLYFGTGLLNDSNEVRTIDQADVDGSKNVNFIMRMTADTEYGFIQDIVAYGLGL